MRVFYSERFEEDNDLSIEISRAIFIPVENVNRDLIKLLRRLEFEHALSDLNGILRNIIFHTQHTLHATITNLNHTHEISTEFLLLTKIQYGTDETRGDEEGEAHDYRYLLD